MISKKVTLGAVNSSMLYSLMMSVEVKSEYEHLVPSLN